MQARKTLILVIVTCALIFGGWWQYYYQRHYVNFSCDALVIYHNDDSEIKASVRYVFDGDNGWLTLHGYLYQNDKFISNISRRIYFSIIDVTKAGSKKEAHLFSESFTRYPTDKTDDQVLKRIVPDFYLRKGLDLSLYISKQNNGNYILSTEYVPLMYCHAVS